MQRTLIYGIIALIIVIAVAAIVFFFTDPNRNGGQPGTDNGNGFFGGLFPFGNGGGGGEPLFEGESPDGTDTRSVPRLREVSANPVSGGYIYENDDTTMIRFIDRASGNMYETEAESTTVTRITNTTVPGIQEVLWADENEFIIRYLDGEVIETFFVTLDTEADGEQNLNGVFIESFDRGSLDETGENLFTVFENENGSNVILSDPNSGDARTILTSSLRSWTPLQSNTGLFVQSSPTAGVNGFLYQIINGTLTKLVGPTPGLTTRIHPDGRYILTSAGTNNALRLSMVDTITNEVLSSPVDTIAEKCTFTTEEDPVLYCGVPGTLPDGAYPDDWLLGRVSFTDDIWLVEPLDGIATFIAAGDEVREQFDILEPKVSANGSHLLFINKNDLSLWSLRLSEE